MKRAKPENDGGENGRQPYLSGACIRSFVKQLSSSRSMRDKPGESATTPPMEQDLPSPPPAKPHKKQVRRRLQTRKPYQEKLLNMAEARREIVTALKLHRAAMQQATQTHQPQIPDQKSRRADVCFSESNVVCAPNFASWHVPSAPLPPPPPPIFQESFDFALPSQALGLNLNLQDFMSTSIYSSSSPSTSSSSPPPAPRSRWGGDEGFEFLNCVGEEEREEELVSSPFDEVMEFPAWLNANESCFHHVPDYFQEPVLPCMEIEEIEGMDGDWLA